MYICLSVSFTGIGLLSLHVKTCSAYRYINPHANYLQSLMLYRECPFMVQGAHRETGEHSQKLFHQQGKRLQCIWVLPSPHCKDLQVLTGTYRHVLLTGIENPCCKFYLLDKFLDKHLQLLLKHVSLTGKFENLLNWQGSPVSGDVS